VIGFYAQQAVEKSIKGALALRDVDFPMLAHDLKFLLTLAANSGLEVPAELTGASWLTAWAITYENGEASPGRLDRQHAIAIGSSAVDWCFAEAGSAPDGREDGSSNAVRSPPPSSSTPGLGRPETRGGSSGQRK
jgi:HEPN domain